jgi:hypothetical protein
MSYNAEPDESIKKINGFLRGKSIITLRPNIESTLESNNVAKMHMINRYLNRDNEVGVRPHDIYYIRMKKVVRP